MCAADFEPCPISSRWDTQRCGRFVVTALGYCDAMPTDLHPDHFKMGVFLNLVMLNASSIAVLRHGPDKPLNEEQARSIAGEAFGIVTGNFLVFDDEEGTLATAYAKPRETIVKVVSEALLAG